MRFVLYTEKTVAQCMAAINERLHARATSARPRMDGWMDKNGSFSIGVQTKVLGRFNRRTYLVAKAERQSGVTTIKGTVADGASPREMLFVFAGLLLVALLLLGSESPLLGVIVFPVAALLYIPLRGDRVNREILLAEVKRILKARSTPPKTKAPARRNASTARAAAGASPAFVARPSPVASSGVEDDDLPEDKPEDEDT
ncbi:MAG: hypothetical protein SNJ59_08925 [Aggregatilineales bacterium]